MGGLDGVYSSGDTIPQQGALGSNPAIERTYREGLRDLSQLRGTLQDNPDLAKDLQELMREMQKYDPSKLTGNPQLVERIRTEILPNIEQLELQLRRKLEGNDGSGQARSGSPERVPQGYADAVAEYFRKLSKTR